jgi:hypothetical protein
MTKTDMQLKQDIEAELRTVLCTMSRCLVWVRH